MGSSPSSTRHIKEKENVQTCDHTCVFFLSFSRVGRSKTLRRFHWWRLSTFGHTYLKEREKCPRLNAINGFPSPDRACNRLWTSIWARSVGPQAQEKETNPLSKKEKKTNMRPPKERKVIWALVFFLFAVKRIQSLWRPLKEEKKRANVSFRHALFSFFFFLIRAYTRIPFSLENDKRKEVFDRAHNKERESSITSFLLFHFL